MTRVFHIGQLRHLYMHMMMGSLGSPPSAAIGLLGPAIQFLEHETDEITKLTQRRDELQYQAREFERERDANRASLNHLAREFGTVHEDPKIINAVLTIRDECVRRRAVVQELAKITGITHGLDGVLVPKTFDGAVSILRIALACTVSAASEAEALRDERDKLKSALKAVLAVQIRDAEAPDVDEDDYIAPAAAFVLGPEDEKYVVNRDKDYDELGDEPGTKCGAGGCTNLQWRGSPEGLCQVCYFLNHQGEGGTMADITRDLIELRALRLALKALSIDADLAEQLKAKNARIAELHQLLVNITHETPYPEEAEENRKRVGILMAEVGTLKAEIAELRRGKET